MNLSVSLSEAVTGDSTATPGRRAQATAHVERNDCGFPFRYVLASGQNQGCGRRTSILQIPSTFKTGHYNKMIERRVAELRRRKALYSTSYYDKKTFWSLYNRPRFLFPGLYARCVECARLRNFYARFNVRIVLPLSASIFFCNIMME